MSGLTVATVNVNGVRAAYRRGMGDWLDERAPDVVALQEVRADDDTLAAHLGPGWHVAHQACAIKGRAGVAVASRLPATAVRLGLAAEEPDVDTGRWVEMDLTLPDGATLSAVSTYIHKGDAGTPTMARKYAYLDRVSARLAELTTGGAHVLVGGDVNIARGPADLTNWTGNHNRTAGAFDEEIAYLERWTGTLGLVDLGRALGGDGPGPFTWWSWRGKAFDNDSGWRIDYQLASPGFAARARTAAVDKAPSYDRRFSDHAPLVVTFVG